MIEENFSFVSQATCKKDRMVKYFGIFFFLSHAKADKNTSYKYIKLFQNM